MTQQPTIYVGSLWHQDCDAFATVMGFNEEQVNDVLNGLAGDEAARCADQDEVDVDDWDDDIMANGVSVEPGSFASEQLEDWQYHDFITDGYVVV